MTPAEWTQKALHDFAASEDGANLIACIEAGIRDACAEATMHERGRCLALVQEISAWSPGSAQDISERIDPTLKAEPLVHYTRVPCQPFCGVDEPNPHTTMMRERVTCSTCRMRMAEDGR